MGESMNKLITFLSLYWIDVTVYNLNLFFFLSTKLVNSTLKGSISNRHKFQRAFWARGLNSLRALTNVCGPKGNNLNLKAYEINAWIFWKGLRQCINVYPEFSRAFPAHTLAFQRALLNFQGLKARGPFLFETLLKGLSIHQPHCQTRWYTIVITSTKQTFIPGLWLPPQSSWVVQRTNVTLILIYNTWISIAFKFNTVINVFCFCFFFVCVMDSMEDIGSIIWRKNKTKQNSKQNNKTTKKSRSHFKYTCIILLQNWSSKRNMWPNAS